MKKDNEIVHREHWEHFHLRKPKMRLPSRLIVTTINLQRILKKHIKPNMKVIEIGFAPGKQLAYVAKKYRANATGIDYSIHGIETAKKLFQTLNLKANLYCEDIFNNSLPPDSFDLVYSIGVIEHFEDPREIIFQHINLLRKGGKALIFIPNYGGVYGRLQKYFDAQNLNIHNLSIMSENSLHALCNDFNIVKATASITGSIDPSLISWHQKWPRSIALMIRLSLNFLGLVQPIKIKALCPWLLLTVEK